MSKNLTDEQIIQKVAELDAEVQALSDAAVTMIEQFRYSQAAHYTSEAAIIHTDQRRWTDLPVSYSYSYNLKQAAEKVRPINKGLAIRLVRLANLIDPPPSKDDDEIQSPYPHLN
jgi:hypothetical protein